MKFKDIKIVFPIAITLICISGIFAFVEVDKSKGITSALVCVTLAWIPTIINKFKDKTRFYIPTVIEILIPIHVFCSVFLGSAVGFYNYVGCWDLLMHTWSGFLFCIVFAWIYYLLKVKLDLFNRLMYLFCLATLSSVVWEVYEFFVDTFFNGNMQRRETGVLDTMEDLVCSLVGSLIFVIVSIVDYRFNENKLTSRMEDSFTDK